MSDPKKPLTGLGPVPPGSYFEASVADPSTAIQRALFRYAVQSLGGDKVGLPEFALAAEGDKPSRTAEMSLTPMGLVCKQKHGTIIVPTSNIIYMRAK